MIDLFNKFHEEMLVLLCKLVSFVSEQITKRSIVYTSLNDI